MHCLTATAVKGAGNFTDQGYCRACCHSGFCLIVFTHSIAGTTVSSRRSQVRCFFHQKYYFKSNGTITGAEKINPYKFLINRHL